MTLLVTNVYYYCYYFYTGYRIALPNLNDATLPSALPVHIQKLSTSKTT